MTSARRVGLAIVALVFAAAVPGATAQEHRPAAAPRDRRTRARARVGFLRGVQGRTDVQIVGVFDRDPLLGGSSSRQPCRPVRVREPRPAARRGEARGGRDVHQHLRPSRGRRGGGDAAHPRDDGEAAGGRAWSTRGASGAPRTSGGIQVIVNYETTWYPSHAAIWKLVQRAARPRARSARWSRWTAIRARRRSTCGRSSSRG